MFTGLIIIIFFMLIALIWAQGEIDKLKKELDLREGKESIEEEVEEDTLMKYEFFVAYCYTLARGKTYGHGWFTCDSANKIINHKDINGFAREAAKNYEIRNGKTADLNIVIINYILMNEKGEI